MQFFEIVFQKNKAGFVVLVLEGQPSYIILVFCQRGTGNGNKLGHRFEPRLTGYNIAVLIQKYITWQAVNSIPIFYINTFPSLHINFKRHKAVGEQFADFWIFERSIIHLLAGCTPGSRGINEYIFFFEVNSGAYDQNSVFINPAFTSVAGFNFKPTQSSIFSMGAAGTGVANDFDNAARSETSTPGAYAVGTGLPVTLLSLEAVRNGADVKLSWATLTEIENKGFEIERSTDGRSFRKMGYAGSEANSGNSNDLLFYDFLDMAARRSGLYYRLKQIDINGQSEYSNVVYVQELGKRKFDISALYPNPSRRTDINLLMSAEESAKVTLLVTDVAGKLLLQQNEVLLQGNNSLTLKVGNLSAGTYFLRAVCSEGCETTVKKFVIQ